jgi:hypothetical protein
MGTFEHTLEKLEVLQIYFHKKAPECGEEHLRGGEARCITGWQVF